MSHDDGAREELHSIVRALRGYVEWHEATGASGFPREARRSPRPRAAAEDAPTQAAPGSDPLPYDAEASDMAPSDTCTESPRAPHEHTTPHQAPREAVSIGVDDALDSAVLDTFVADPAPRRPPPAAARPSDGRCPRCGVETSAPQPGSWRGPLTARVCFVGEALRGDTPGPVFEGLAGALLDRMIRAMGLDPQTDTLVHTLWACVAAEGLTGDALQGYRSHLEAQLATASPTIIVTLGETATAALLGTSSTFDKLRGQWKLYRGKVLVMPTHHPELLLREDAAQKRVKREAWEHLQAVMKELADTPA